MNKKRVQKVIIYFDDGTYQELFGASSIFDELPLRVPNDTYIGTSPPPVTFPPPSTHTWPDSAPIKLYESPTLTYPPGCRGNGMQVKD